MIGTASQVVATKKFWESEMDPPSEKWISFGIKDEIGFTESKLLGFTPDTFREMNKAFRKYADLSEEKEATVGLYKNIFEECVTKKGWQGQDAKTKAGRKVRRLASKLALSDPKKMFPSDWWINGTVKQYDASTACGLQRT